MYFETGQGSALSAEAHHGVDQQTMEARAYAVARRYRPLLVNTVVGFIGPEYLYDGKQIVRAGLEDHFCGKLLGLPMGVDVCYTNHAEADQDDMDTLLTLLGVAGCNYVMGVPGADDVMLSYQSTSFHDALYVRSVLGLRPAPEFEAWLERMGILDAAGRVRPRAGARRGCPPACRAPWRMTRTTPGVGCGAGPRRGSRSAEPAMRCRPGGCWSSSSPMRRRATRSTIPWMSSGWPETWMGSAPSRSRSQARNRAEYLRRPDLGRRLDPDRGPAQAPGPYDAAVVLADGLSARAVQRVRAGVGARPARGAARLGLGAGRDRDPSPRRTRRRHCRASRSRARCGADRRAAGAVRCGQPRRLHHMAASPGRDPRCGAQLCLEYPGGSVFPSAKAAARIFALMVAAQRLGMTGVGLKEDDALALSTSQSPPAALE